jgi:hypothetical protein
VAIKKHNLLLNKKCEILSFMMLTIRLLGNSTFDMFFSSFFVEMKHIKHDFYFFKNMINKINKFYNCSNDFKKIFLKK